MTAPRLAEAPGTSVPRLDRLVCRLAGGMALLAAAVFLTVLFFVTRLPFVESVTDGTAAYAIPGTRHLIDAAIVPVLAWSGGVAALLGCAVVGLGGFAPRAPRSLTAVAKANRPSWKRPVILLFGGAVALATVLLLKR